MNADTYKFIYHKTLFVLAAMLLCVSAALAEKTHLQLTCPDDITVQLAPNECNAIVVFDTAVWSSTEPLIDTVFFPASGSFFGVGTAVITLAATTVSGQLEVCTFQVIVEEFEPVSLNCINNVALELNESCERSFTPGELLNLDSIGCLSNYLAARILPDGTTGLPEISSSDINAPFVAVVQHQTNMSQCSTTVTVTGGVPPAISCPSDITIACNTHLFPSIVGIPDTTGCFEDISLTYFDQVATTLCTDSFSFQTTRSWLATDPFGNIDACQQIITGKRVNLSLIEFPGDYDNSEFSPLSCSNGMDWEEVADPVFTGKPFLGGFPIDDNSMCDITTNFQDVATNVCGASYNIERIWTVVNLCDATEVVKDTQYIQIIDTIPPIFSLPDTLFASINALCFDSLYLPGVEDINECSTFDVEIRTPWDTLYSDGGWTPLQLIAGIYPITYILTDHCNNSTTGLTQLKIEDQTLVTCPADTTINCDLYYGTIAPAIGFNDFDILNTLGVPEYHGNCDLTFSEEDSISVDGCGVGLVVRTLTADSVSTDVCEQNIFVEHVSNFTVEFPAHLEICESPSIELLGEPVITGVSCENMVTSSSDEIITSGILGCYTVERTWTITNACSYSGNNLGDDIPLDSITFADGGDGIIEYKQIVMVNDREGPVFTNGCGFPDLYVFQNNCEITVTVPTPDVESCELVEFTISGDLGEVMGENVPLTPGSYSMNYIAIDECGKVGSCIDTFLVVDSIPPATFCQQGIVVEFLPSSPPMAEIFAVDFDDGSFDNCGDSLNYYFLTDSLVQQIVFNDCCQTGPQNLTFVAEDQYGNLGYCSTTIILQHNLSNCDCDPLIEGNISTEAALGINNVDLTISSPNGFMVNIDTDVNGDFMTILPSGESVTATPQKNTNHINGVTTFDAVLMTRHILNVELLDSPYKIIAADINRSNHVTTFDIVEMRKLILNINSNFPNNTSWRFVDAAYVFPNPIDPWEETFPEVININNVSNQMIELDFVGIKIGDLNGSADPQE